MSDLIDPGIPILTVHQPWAWALITGRKPVENRGWYTRHRGPLYIHAGKPFATDARQLIPDPPARADRPDADPVEQLVFGAILGLVVVRDLIRDHPSPWAIPGQWHWVVSDPEPFPRAVPSRGFPSLWRWPGY